MVAGLRRSRSAATTGRMLYIYTVSCALLPFAAVLNGRRRELSCGGPTPPEGWIHNVYPRHTLRRVKDAGIRIRVEKDLRSAFAAACQTERKQASDVLREFMEAYVARFQGGQGDLFVERHSEVAAQAAVPGTQHT